MPSLIYKRSTSLFITKYASIEISKLQLFTNSVFETLSFGCREIGRKEITPSFSFNFRARQTSRRRNEASSQGFLSNFKYKSTEIWPLHTQLIKFFNVNKEE